MDYINSIVEKLFHLRETLYNTREPAFVTINNQVIETEYIECFPKPDGRYDCYSISLSEASDGAQFRLCKHSGAKLLTNKADIRLAANKNYQDIISNNPSYPELTKFLADIIEDLNYFRDIKGSEYYNIENGDFVGFKIQTNEDRSFEVDFFIDYYSFKIKRTDGRHVNEIPDIILASMKALLDELEQWADGILLPNKS